MLCDIKLIWKDFFELYYVVALLKLHFVLVKKLHLVITQRRQIVSCEVCLLCFWRIIKRNSWHFVKCLFDSTHVYMPNKLTTHWCTPCIPKGLRSGDRGSHLSTVNTCSREQFEMSWVLWHGAVSWCKQSPGDGYIVHKGMDIVSYTTEAGCDI